MEAAPPRVSIIILNWNGWKDTLECLESVYQNDYPAYDVIVVDNGSENDSVEKIKSYAAGKISVESPFFTYSEDNKPINYIEYSHEEAESGGGKEGELYGFPPEKCLIIIKNEKNYGFAEGNNIAIRYSKKGLNPEYILLLNNDTVVDKKFLIELVNRANIDESGFFGPKVYYYNYQGKKNVIHSAGAKINIRLGTFPIFGYKEVDHGQYDYIKQVDYLEGACLLVSSKTIDKIGLLDPFFFTYWEETDWCYRGLKEGYKNTYVPFSRIWHKVKDRNMSKNTMYFITRNLFVFIRKNGNNIDLFIFLLYFIMFHFWSQLAMILFYFRDVSLLVPYLKGIKDGLKYLKNI